VSASAIPRHHHAFKFIVLLAALIVAAVAMEVGVRVLRLAPPIPEQYGHNVLDAVLPWKIEPGSIAKGATPEFAFEYRHNSQGFRDTEHTFQKPQDTFRIIGLGDSFTYGVGAAFDDTILARLERQLNVDTGGSPHVEIIKAGIPRFWPEPERLLLEHYGIQYHPDVVLVIFLPNDIADTVAGLKGLTVSQGYLVSRERDTLGSAGQWMYMHSGAFRALAAPILSRRVYAQDEAAGAAAARNDFEPHWRKIESEYDQMLAIATRSHARLAIAHIPQAITDDPPARIIAWCRRNGVTMIDTLPALRRAAATGTTPLYYPVDRHCTPEGYRVVAETIHSGLRDARLVPGAPGDDRRH
jgi:hypothetical protein